LAEVGSKLRDMRLRQNLTLQQVEKRSFSFAREQNDSAYRISAGWLSRLERGGHDLSLRKLILLAHIYLVDPIQLIQIVHSPGHVTTSIRNPHGPNSTMMLASGPLDDQAQYLLQGVRSGDDLPDETRLLSNTDGVHNESRYLRGVIGRRDCFLNPLVPPGSVVVVDTKQRAILTGKQRKSEFQRPIYLLLTHESYICGWCDLDRASDWLTVVSHPLSGVNSRRLKYRREIETLGRVVVVSAPWERQWNSPL
jgi:transcriptional regulator with XRE-family HTH domain